MSAMKRIGRELWHLLRTTAIGLAATALLLLTLFALAASLIGIGLPILVFAVDRTRRLAGVQRRRCAPPVESAYLPPPTGLVPRARAIVTDAATWRDLAWLAAQAPLGLFAIVVVGLWGSALQGVTMPLVRS